MHALILDLRPRPASPLSRFLQRITLLLIGTLNLFEAQYLHNAFRYVNLVAGIFVLAMAVLFRFVYKSRTLTFGDESIVGTLGDREEINLPWNELDRIELRQYTMHVITRGGQKTKVDLTNITLQQEQQVIPQVLIFAKSKGVKVNILW